MPQRKSFIIDKDGKKIEVEPRKSKGVRKSLAEKSQKRPSLEGFAKILLIIFVISSVMFFTTIAIAALHLISNRAGTVGPVISYIGFAGMLLLLASGAGLVVIVLISGIGFIVNLIS